MAKCKDCRAAAARERYRRDATHRAHLVATAAEWRARRRTVLAAQRWLRVQEGRHVLLREMTPELVAYVRSKIDANRMEREAKRATAAAIHESRQADLERRTRERAEVAREPARTLLPLLFALDNFR